MKNNKRCYEYVLIEGIFVNLDQSIIMLYYNLYKRGRPFSNFDRPANIRMPKFLVRAIRVFQFVLKFYKKKNDFPQNPHSIKKSEHFGHCLIELRQGELKVLNFKKKLVKIIFPKHISIIEVEKRIKVIKEAEKCTLAPRVITWNIKKRYLIEEYVNMSTCFYTLININCFIGKISPVLGEVLLTTNHKCVDLKRYISNKTTDLHALMININGSSIVKDFLDHSIKVLNEKVVKEEITLVFSHGDFWEGNILLNDKESKVIDWNTLGYRSLYYDFYYSIFMLASKNKPFNKIDQKSLTLLRNKIGTSCQLFYNNLHEIYKNKKYDAEIPKNFQVYRYLFYIELIMLKLEATHNHPKNKVKEIITWINRFKHFEQLRT